MIFKMKSTTKKVVEIFVLYTIIKHLLFGIYKELLPFDRKQTQTKMEKMGKQYENVYPINRKLHFIS